MSHLLSGFLATQQGAMQGAQQGRADALAQQQQDFTQQLNLGQLLQSEQDRQQRLQEQQTNAMGSLLGSDYLDQGTGQTLLNTYAQRLTAPPAAGVDAFAGARQTPYYQRHLGGRGLPAAPGATGGFAGQGAGAPAALDMQGQPVVGQAATAAPALTFVPKAQKTAEAEYSKYLDGVSSQALWGGDKATGDALAGIKTDLTLGKINLDQAKKQAETLTVQGRKKNDSQTSLDRTAAEINKLQDSLSITEPYLPRASRILDQIQALGALDTPQKVAQATALQRQWTALKGRHGVLQPNAQQQSLMQDRDARALGGVQDRATKIHSALTSGRLSPEEALSQIQDFRAYTQNPLLQKLGGGHEFAQFGVNLDPQEVPVIGADGTQTGTRTETPDEVKARNLTEIAPLVGNAHDQQQYRLGAYRAMLRFVQASLPKINDPDQRVGMISRLNQLAEQANLPGVPPDLTAGMTEGEKARVGVQQKHQATYDNAQKATTRHQTFMEGIADRNAGSNEVNASAHAASTEVGNWLKQVQGENAGYDRLLKQWNQQRRVPPAVVSEAAGYQSRINGLSQRIGILMTGPNNDFPQVGELNKNLQDLINARNALLDPYKNGTAPPVPPAVGSPPSPVIGAQRRGGSSPAPKYQKGTGQQFSADEQEGISYAVSRGMSRQEAEKRTLARRNR